jgi:adenosylcobinamide-GDP ribazoletransferase
MVVLMVLCAVLMCVLNLPLGITALVAAFVVFIYYRHMAYKNFGGTTGDLCGFFLQICELTMALAIVVVNAVM